MSLHNPANLDLTLVGPNHKLLSTDDLDKPLPEGSEFWSDIGKQWYPSNVDTARPSLTYRIPLSLSDRLRSEQQKHWDEKEEQIRVVEAVEKGKEWEVNWIGTGKGWERPIHSLDYYITNHAPIRLKPIPPTPRSIPWTLETHPDVVCVKPNNAPKNHLLITRWNEKGGFMDYGFVSYEELHSDWLQRNGQPAGQEVQG